MEAEIWKKKFECEVEKIVVQSESVQERWNSLEHDLNKAAEKYVDGRKGERTVKKRGGGMKKLRKLLGGKKKGIRNGGNTGTKRIWRHIKCWRRR